MWLCVGCYLFFLACCWLRHDVHGRPLWLNSCRESIQVLCAVLINTVLFCLCNLCKFQSGLMGCRGVFFKLNVYTEVIGYSFWACVVKSCIKCSDFVCFYKVIYCKCDRWIMYLDLLKVWKHWNLFIFNPLHVVYLISFCFRWRENESTF